MARSSRNIGYACDVTKTMNARLTLIHVVTLPAVVEPGFPIDPKPFEDAGLRVLENAKEIAKERGIEVETVLETTFGNAAQKILKVAEERKIDLIVIGSRGYSRLRNLLVGSVCDTVVRNAPCPVLVVR
jgi:nucleotide-binding universal stress UspA family protein